MVAVGALCCRQVVWRAPKFQVPLSPLAPCAAILADVFLIVSLGPAAHLQFGVWTALAVLAYAVYGVHSTPDVDAGTAGQGESELVMGHEWSSQEGSRVGVPGMSVPSVAPCGRMTHMWEINWIRLAAQSGAR